MVGSYVLMLMLINMLLFSSATACGSELGTTTVVFSVAVIFVAVLANYYANKGVKSNWGVDGLVILISGILLYISAKQMFSTDAQALFCEKNQFGGLPYLLFIALSVMMTILNLVKIIDQLRDRYKDKGRNQIIK